MEQDQPQKLYYSIREVARMFHVNPSLLRYWEDIFDTISPKKSDRGIRFYSQKDIEAIRLVYYLVKEKGLTLTGAKQKLKYNRNETERQEEIIHRLKTIRDELNALKKSFDEI